MKFSADTKQVTMIATFAALDPTHPDSKGMADEMREGAQNMSSAQDDWEDGVIGGGLMVLDGFNPSNTGNVDRNEDGSIKYEPGLEFPSVALLGTYTRDQLLALVVEMSDEVKTPPSGEPQ